MKQIGANPLPVIVADDDRVGLLLLQQAVKVAGHTPLAFDNGAAALDAALAHPASLIVLDGDMPGMDGYTVCRRLRVEARLAATPIVIVTGQEDQSAVARAFDAGATEFLPKPVNFALLPHRIEYMLRNAARESQVVTLLEALPDRLWVATGEGTIRWTTCASPAGGDGGPGSSLWSALDPNDTRRELRAALSATADDGVMRQLSYAESDGGGPRHYEVRLTRRAGGDVVVVQRDTTERAQAAQRIERLAFYDSLTQLPNRQRCMELGERLLQEARDEGSEVALLYLDLNGFKRINDTFGLRVGDAVLKSVARKLNQSLEEFQQRGVAATLTRFGSDEFVCLVPGTAVSECAREIADTFCAVLNVPVAYDRFEFHTAPSIGIAVFPHHGADMVTVLKHADAAMYHARMTGATPVATYHASMSGRKRSWAELELRLRRAISGDTLRMHYQPKFSLSDGALRGVEALARWPDPEHGEIKPVQFIPVAEESSLIIDLGAWVIRAACRQIRQWQDRGLTVPIAINISAKELLYADPAGIIATEARAEGISTSLIEIEITESMMVRDSEAVSEAVRRFRQLGCRIALDDFGTGYSSMSYITRFRPDRIKIDRSFVTQVDASPADAAIAAAILSLGRSLNLTITAEGIERRGQLEWLRHSGCDEGQGYLLARPAAADAIDQWLHGTRLDESSTDDPIEVSQKQAFENCAALCRGLSGGK